MSELVRVVVDLGPAHLDRPFDYLCPADADIGVGSRVRVRFNGRPRIAWVTSLPDEPLTEPERLKPIERIDGTVRWFTRDDVTAWRWVADRFAGTLSGVIRHALPRRIVRVEKEAASWDTPAAPTQASTRPPCASDAWRPLDGGPLLNEVFRGGHGAYHLRTPLGGDDTPLLADLIARCIAAGRQAVVVAPGPTGGIAADLLAAAGSNAADLRGDVADADRYRIFLRGLAGDVGLIVGERSVALMPVRNLGLMIVLDEANPAYKERRNPRHHVRDAALGRGHVLGATTVLTSSVLSPQAIQHHRGGHLTLVRADRGTERVQAPGVLLLDRSTMPPSERRTRLAGPAARRIATAVGDGGAVIVLAAQRGSGSSLACATCRVRLECRVCDGGVSPDRTAPADTERWRCGSCDWTGPPTACRDCGSVDVVPLRAGAKLLGAELAKTHPEADVQVMEGFDAIGPARRPAIAVMTRGSVVARPSWLEGERADLLVIADPDTLLGRPAIDAPEDALRLWFDAARLAEDVVIQTYRPTETAVQAFVRNDPDGFWEDETERRAPLGFPPVGHLIRFASLKAPEAAELRRSDVGTLLGPDADGVALLKTADLRGTLQSLRPLRREWALQDRRVIIDVDPVSAI